MFKKYYKEANDNIQPNRALIDKIFEEAEKSSVRKPFPKVYKFGTAVAAVLVLAVSAGYFIHFDVEPSQNNKPQLAVEIQNPKVTVETENKQEEKKAGSETINSDEAKRGNDESKTHKKEDVQIAPKEQNNAEGQTTTDNGKTKKTETVVIPITPENEAPSAEVGQEPVLAMANEAEQPAAFSGRTVNEAEEVPETEEASLENLTEVADAESSVINSMLVSALGESDGDSGGQYVFEIVGKNEDIYFGIWKEVNDGESSLKSDFVVTSDMSAMYECEHTGNGKIHWTTEENLLLD